MLGKKKKLKEYKKTPEDLIKDNHTQLKKVVDSIFDSTKTRHGEMTKRLNEYRNKVWDIDKLGKGDSQISFNFLFAVVSTISALLTDSKPKPKVIPEQPYLFGTVSDVYNRNIDYVWDSLELQDMIYKTCIWAETTGLGIAEVGYSKGEGCKGLYYDIIDPRDFFVAPGYEDIKDVPFCGVRETVPVSKVKALFPDADLSEDMFFTEDDDSKAIDEKLKYTDANDSFVYQEAGRIRWYRVWMKTDEILEKNDDGDDLKVFPHGIMVYYTDDKYLGYVENEYAHGLPPYVVLTDYYNPGMFDSIGEGDQIWGITKEINLQIQAMMKRARRQSDPSCLIDSSQMADIEQIKQDEQAGKFGQVYAYDGSTSSGKAVVQHLLPKETDSTSWQIISSFKGIIEYVLGYTDMLRGETTKSERQSAVEVSILSEASSVRIRPKIRNLEKFIKRLTHQYVCLMQQYWIGDNSISVNTEEGREYYNFSSTRQGVTDMIVDDKVLKEVADLGEAALTDTLDEEEVRQYDDYKRFKEWADGQESEGMMFPFEVAVESDSTLPLDRQSRAQLMLRLYSMKAVDREALLTALEIPDKDDIIKRMAKLDKAGAKSTAGMKMPKQGVQNV